MVCARCRLDLPAHLLSPDERWHGGLLCPTCRRAVDLGVEPRREEPVHLSTSSARDGGTPLSPEILEVVRAIHEAAAKSRDHLVSSDDVAPLLPNRGNQIGTAFRELASRGILSFQRRVPSRLPQAHGRGIAVWRVWPERWRQLGALVGA